LSKELTLKILWFNDIAIDKGNVKHQSLAEGFV
jgi:hypothetical protein